MVTIDANILRHRTAVQAGGRMCTAGCWLIHWLVPLLPGGVVAAQQHLSDGQALIEQFVATSVRYDSITLDRDHIDAAHDQQELAFCNHHNWLLLLTTVSVRG